MAKNHDLPISTGAFRIANGQIIGPTRKPFVVQGPALLDGMMASVSAADILSKFPKANSVNLACGADGNGYATAQPLSDIFAWVDDATSKGLVVILSDYVPGAPSVRTGDDLTASLDWLATVAANYVRNPRVWFTTENEVRDADGDTATMHLATYNAIRTAGNNGLIFMESQSGNPNTNGLDPSIYANMTGVGWNIHIYPWEFPPSVNQADYDNKVKNFVSTFQKFAKSRDGIMPVLVGEGGNSSGGNAVAAEDTKIGGKFAVTQSILNTSGVTGGTCGFTMWLWSWYGQGGDSDTLVNISTGALTDFGQQVAAGMRARDA
jgi:hypothetical protein